MRGFLLAANVVLQLDNIGGSRSLGAVYDIELYTITLGQAFEPFGIYC